MTTGTSTEQEHAMSTQIAQSPGDPSTTDQVKEKAQEEAGHAREKARSQLRSQVDQRSTDAGHRVGGFAADVRSVSETLREQGKDQPAKLADQAADRAERLSRYLEESDADRILDDIEDFGRRQPWAVIAGGLALGLVASRLLKASSSDRYQRRTGQLPERAPELRDPAVPTTPAVPASPTTRHASG
jgi:ElaB/YqjD/DUF883 family membrane-anchored ribosome-binding protein